MRGVISDDYPNGKEHRLLPGVAKPGDRSSEQQSKSSMFSRRCAGEPERSEVTESSIPFIRRATLYGQLPFELDRRVADSKAVAQLLIDSLQKIVIASGLRFNQMHG